MNNLTFGRYASYNTLVHKLDPRTKILLTVFLMVIIFMPFKLWSTTLILSGIYLLLLLCIMIASKVSILSLFKSLLGMWFLILFLFIIYIFIPNESYTHIAWECNGFKLYWDSFYQASYIILRLFLMVAVTMILTSTTKPFDLTYALEWYMTPLKVIKFPTHIIAMMISIALRFIPTILEETERIMKAQSSRGVDFTHGRLMKRFRAIISLIIPLFVSAFERSEELANAMEVRGYDPRGTRTRYRKLKFHFKDLVSAMIVGTLFGFIIYLSIAQNDLDIIKLLSGVVVGF